MLLSAASRVTPLPMDPALLDAMTAELLAIEGLCGVFYDLTHNSPATIEWE